MDEEHQPIPGQMDIYEVLADIERAGPTSKGTPMEDLQRASDVPLDPAALGKTEADLRRERAARAVRARQARAEVLRRAGALDPSDMAARLEARTRRIQDRAIESFKIKKAVADRLGRKEQS